MLKLKAAPRASLLALFTGQHGVVSLKAKLISLDRFYAAGQLSGFQLNGIENLKHSLQFSSNSDKADEFSELGPPKLMTEKREVFKKTVKTKKASSSSSVPSEISKTLKGSLPNSIKRPAALQPKHSKSTDISGSSLDKNGLKINRLKSVTIRNVPSMIQLPELKEAMSSFGNISNASMRTVPSGLDCYDIEFESVESRDKALSVGRITVNNFNFSIRPLDAIDIVTITIGNICSETADSAIRSLCKSCGYLEGLVRKKKDVVDTLFGVEDKSEGQRILRKLNNTIMDGCKWHARLQTKEPYSEPTKSENTQLCSGLKVVGYIDDLRRRTALLRVSAEDLEILHHSILHIENDPVSSRDLSSSN